MENVGGEDHVEGAGLETLRLRLPVDIEDPELEMGRSPKRCSALDRNTGERSVKV